MTTKPIPSDRPQSTLAQECKMMLSTLDDVIDAAERNIAQYIRDGGPQPAATEAARDARRILADTEHKARGTYAEVLRGLVRVVGRWATHPPKLGRLGSANGGHGA